MVHSVLAAALLAGCTGQGLIKPAEVLDERTGATVGALQEPIEFVETAPNAALGGGKRTSFAYLGPVEWDRSGDLTYGLWVHVAPGNDRQVADLHLSGAVALILDDGPLPLTLMDAPPVGRSPYRPVASWGQTAYFALDVITLKRMAASGKLVLVFRAADQSDIDFAPTHDTRASLTKFERARGISVD